MIVLILKEQIVKEVGSLLLLRVSEDISEVDRGAGVDWSKETEAGL